MLTEKDFTGRKNFPGTTGNLFDLALHAIVKIEALPWPLFSILLFGTACIPFWGRWLPAVSLWLFFLLDWCLIAMLPKAQKSFGPPRPPALLLAVLRLPFAFLPLPIFYIFQTVGTLLVIYSFWFEPHQIVLSRQSLSSPKLQTGVHLKVLHLGDLHVERISMREQQVNQMIKDLQPDLILFSGDFLNLSYRSDPQALECAREILMEWQAPLGAYATAGSPAVDLADRMPALFRGLPVQHLTAERRLLDHQGAQFALIGIDCTHKPFEDGPRLQALNRENDGRFTILLYHSPDLVPLTAREGIDLQLSGHTHGGQVRLPWIGALFTGSLYGKQLEAGRYQFGETTLYITRGIGMEGAGAPRVRFLCPPEVILWDIRGTGSGSSPIAHS